MKSISIQLQKKTQVLTVEHPAERFVLQACLFMLGLLLVGYLYFVCQSILNVMARQEAEHRATSLAGEIGALEQRFFSLSHTITPAEAQTLGLKALRSTSYVHRPGEVGVSEVSRNAI